MHFSLLNGVSSGEWTSLYELMRHLFRYHMRHRFKKLSLCGGYQINRIFSSKGEISGWVNFDQDGITERSEQEENGILGTSFFHGVSDSIRYELSFTGQKPG